MYKPIKRDENKMLRITRRSLKSTQVYLYSKRGSNRYAEQKFQVQSIDEPLDLPRSRFQNRKMDFQNSIFYC